MTVPSMLLQVTFFTRKFSNFLNSSYKTQNKKLTQLKTDGAPGPAFRKKYEFSTKYSYIFIL